MVGDQHDGIAVMRQCLPETVCSTVPFVRMNTTSTQAIPSGTSAVLHLPVI